MFSLSTYIRDENIKSSIRMYDYEVPKIDIYEYVIDELVRLDPMSVLEIGCGDGSFLKRMRTKFYKGPLTGIDVSLEMIDKAKVDSRDILYKVMDANNMSFTDGSFDIIVANFTLHTMPNIAQTMQEIYRVLKSEGKFLGAVHGMDHLPKRKKYLKMALEFLPGTESINPLERVTLNNLNTFMQKFENLQTNGYKSEIKLDDPKIYVEYIDNLRDYVFEPIPDNASWNNVLNMVESSIAEEMADRGIFTETTHVGYFKTLKPL